jgi:hypothetical protein
MSFLGASGKNDGNTYSTFMILFTNSLVEFSSKGRSKEKTIQEKEDEGVTRETSCKHYIENYGTTPHISWLPIIFFTQQNLWSSVIWSSTLSLKNSKIS